MSKNFEILKGLFGDQISELTEENRDVLSEKLDKLLEARVDAKVKFQTEVIEEDAKEKYQTLLKEATTKFEGGLKKTEEKAFEKAAQYKTKLQESLKATVKDITEKKESEAAAYKKTMVEKLDKYLNYELDRRIPDTYVEEAAKAAIFEPMVSGIKKIMEENGIKLDEENFGIIRDARKEIIKTREEMATAIKENMELADQLKDHKRTMKISEVCEGLTDAQRERASKLLEGCDVDEIDGKFGAIRDFIIEGFDVKKDPKKDLKKGEEEVNEEEGDDDSVAPAAVGGEKGEVEEAEKEEDISGVVTPEKAEDPITERFNAECKSWAQEFKRISGVR